MTLAALKDAARHDALEVIGTCAARPEDGLEDGTIALLGPSEPGFWDRIRVAPEFTDCVAHPMDRWSRRVITTLAARVDGLPLFPFGAPLRPFMTWALRSGRAWSSPVGLLVHETAGLLVSYRGAVWLPEEMHESPSVNRPCGTCDGMPCLTACPIGALSTGSYDVAACHDHLDEEGGKDCLTSGCRVRLSCPISQQYPRDARQSAFHMAAFHNRN